MKERDAARWFAREVDGMLARRSQSGPAEIVPFECAGDLEIARSLSACDFSELSGSFASLRNAVPVEAPRRSLRSRLEEIITTRLLRPFPAFLAVLVLAVALIQCTYPGGVPGLTKAIQDTIVAQMNVGPRTQVIQWTDDQEAMDKAVAAIPQELKDRMWTVNTGAGAYGGSVPAGASTAVPRFDTYEAARASVAFTFKVPRTMLSQFKLRDVYVAPDGQQVIAVYADPNGAEIVIAQGSFGTGNTAYGVGSNSPFQSVDLDGTKAAWFPTLGMLVWESELSYSIAGHILSLEDAKLIWEGMQ